MQTETSRLSDQIAEEMGQFPALVNLSTQRLVADVQAKFVVSWNVAFSAVTRFRELVRRLSDGQ